MSKLHSYVIITSSQYEQGVGHTGTKHIPQYQLYTNQFKVLPHSGLIFRGENFEVLLYPQNFNHEFFRHSTEGIIMKIIR